LELGDIVQAWGRRQREVHSVEFRWIEIHTDGDVGTTVGGSRPRTASVQPPYVTCRYEARLSICGNKVNYERKIIGTLPHPGLLKTYRGTFDGQVSYVFSLGPMPRGKVTPGRLERDRGLLYLKPIFLTYRGLDAGFDGMQPGSYRLSAHRGVVEGRACVILEQSNQRLVRNAFWVCPEMDFSVLRYTASVEGKEIIRLDIAYRRGARYGWVPKHWKSVWVNPETGALVEGGESTVTSYVINEAIPEEEFRIAFPDGTWVTDETTGQEYLVRNGRKRLITAREKREASYKELLSTESGEARKSPWWLYLRWFLWSSFFLAMAVFALFFGRKWRSGNIAGP